VVLVANIKLCMLQMSWSSYGAVLWFVGVVAYLPLTPIISSYWVSMFSTEYGSFQNTLAQETYWLVIPICLVVSLLRHYTWTAICRRFYPLPWQIVQEQYVLHGKKALHDRAMSRIDIEAGGIPVVNGILQDDETAYINSSSPVRRCCCYCPECLNLLTNHFHAALFAPAIARIRAGPVRQDAGVWQRLRVQLRPADVAGRVVHVDARGAPVGLGHERRRTPRPEVSRRLARVRLRVGALGRSRGLDQGLLVDGALRLAARFSYTIFTNSASRNPNVVSLKL